MPAVPVPCCSGQWYRAYGNENWEFAENVRRGLRGAGGAARAAGACMLRRALGTLPCLPACPGYAEPLVWAPNILSQRRGARATPGVPSCRA